MSNFTISNEEELQLAVTEASIRLQAIQDYCGIQKNEFARVNFPRGFLRSAAYHRKRMPLGLDPLLLHNISYSLMTLDVFRWMIVRTDIAGTAQSMVIKRAISILAEIIETIVKTYSGKRRFDPAVDWLKKHEVVDDECMEKLKHIWRLRSSIHLWEAKVLEHNRYKTDDYNNAMVVYEQLRSGLVKKFGKHS